MHSYIREYLYRDMPLTVTPDMATQLIRMVVQFEIRDEHPLTLNSQMFGVNKFNFTSRERRLFFDIIGYTEEDVKGIIDKIPSIHNERIVTSDAFSVASVYVAHRILVSNIPHNLKQDATISVLNYFQYRFFGSIIWNNFRYSAKYEIMQTVIEGLSMKFAVRQLGSWKKVIQERSEVLTSNTKVHDDTLLNFNNDIKILYVITDTSTRIRSQVKIITSDYYEMREANNFITSHSSTASIDGAKVLREKDGSFETISSTVFNRLLIKSSFVDERYIKMVQSTVPRLNVGIIRRMLTTISDEARNQMDLGTLYKIVQRRDGVEVYVGIEELINHVVHVIYSTAVHNKRININSKIAIYTNTKNVFTAARSANQELINVRASLEDIIHRTRISTREATVSGLGVVFALYITLLSFGSL